MRPRHACHRRPQQPVRPAPVHGTARPLRPPGRVAVARARTAGGAGPWWTTSCRASPGLILDVATGPAGVALQLAPRTGAHVVGVDLTEAMIRQGHAQRGARRVPRSRSRSCWARASSCPSPTPPSTPSPSPTCCATSRTPPATLRELARVVRPGGDGRPTSSSSSPPAAFWRFWWWGYTRLVLPVGGRDHRRPGVVRRWGASSGPTSPRTTAATRWRGRSRRGATPGSTTSGCGP